MRLVHLPTGLMVTATERRSQATNLEAAFARMRERLEERNRPVIPRKATRVPQGEKTRRRESKRRQGEKKSLRRPPSDQE